MVTVYRLTAETLARPKPSVATLNVESALREFDQYPNVFRRLGQYWVIKYDSEMVILNSSGGLSYLARLLVDPGRKIPAAFLLAAEMGIDPRIPVGSSGPVASGKISIQWLSPRELRGNAEIHMKARDSYSESLFDKNVLPIGNSSAYERQK